MENIDKIIFNQYKLFNKENDIKDKKIYFNFVDEIISSYIMIYDIIENNCLKIKEIYNYEEIKNEINWKIENSLKIPYLNNIRIKAMKFNKNNKDLIKYNIS